MPIYEYECKECGHAFDALQKISDEPLSDCPDCGISSLRKLVSAPNFRLKGSGWYETDFKDKNKRNLAGSSDKTSAEKSDTNKSTDSKSEAKSKSAGDSKPAASSDD